MLFYIVQFFLSRGDRIVGLVRQETGGHRLRGSDDRLHYRCLDGKLPRHVGMLGWLWGVGDTCLSEFFRTSLRATRFGIMVGGGRVVLIAGPYLVGWGIEIFGPTVPFLVTSARWLGTIGYLLGLETSGRELEEIQL
jgi:hypothetical protein